MSNNVREAFGFPFFIIVLSTLISCSTAKSLLESIPFVGTQKSSLTTNDFANADYRKQLETSSKDFSATYSDKIVTLSPKTITYFTNLTSSIRGNNELVIKDDKFTLTFIDVDIPYIFSLPGGAIFISTRMMKEFLRNEDLFVAAVTYELIRSSNSIYKKKLIIPVGYIETERILSIVRLSIETKIEIDKLTYYSLKRAGYDPYTVLSFIQLINKHTQSFVRMYGDRESISKEEYLFKQFLIKSDEINKHRSIERRPMKEFYTQLLNDIEKPQLGRAK